eukprot:TRINITY_DN7903_c1_g2_i1.p1 TRINITY_DN7903_c1_g2~~TRINITY_DN7903_c1_g2_i1.p1  ORF type:complete len:501 (+),score=137.71 TRINITY_DN7903_c1_g2_i1:96-1505(+)
MPLRGPLDIAKRFSFTRRNSAAVLSKSQHDTECGPASPRLRAGSVGSPPPLPVTETDDLPADILEAVYQRKPDVALGLPSPAARAPTASRSSATRAASRDTCFATAQSGSVAEHAASVEATSPGAGDGHSASPEAESVDALQRRLSEMAAMLEEAESRARAKEAEHTATLEGVKKYGEKVQATKQQLRLRIAALEAQVLGLKRRCADAEGAAESLRSELQEAESRRYAARADASAQASSFMTVAVTQTSFHRRHVGSQTADLRRPRSGLLTLRYGFHADGIADPRCDGCCAAKTTMAVADTDSVADLLRRCCAVAGDRAGVPCDPSTSCLRADEEDVSCPAPLGLLRSAFEPEGRRREREFTLANSKGIGEFSFFQQWIESQADPFHIALTLVPAARLQTPTGTPRVLTPPSSAPRPPGAETPGTPGAARSRAPEKRAPRSRSASVGRRSASASRPPLPRRRHKLTAET